MQTVALIDYDSGNVHSAQRALVEAARLADKRVNVQLTADPGIISRADRIVLPGVGHFAQCKGELAARTGVIEAMDEAVHRKGRPFLGICVGMQLLADFSLEDGETSGLGWIHGMVQPIEPGAGLRIPHMGWNGLEICQRHPVLDDLGEDPHAYFVHSYALSPEDEGQIAALADYGRPIVAAVARENIFGTQFHPEKSQAVGLKLLSNFLSWRP
ncbi:MAG: imidazole glycerol phosphate synthase subunit HisH [Hyphomonadaceae bacterium]|nr:imidazole glycerol phosphate synthase subunit HisH [Hyphomonadaceae bacterium]